MAKHHDQHDDHPGWKVHPALGLKVGPGFDLSGVDRAATPGWERSEKAGERRLVQHGEEFAQLQERLFAQGRDGDGPSVLLVLQGMDTSGKGGIVRHVIGLVDPQGVHHRAFGKPTAQELRHHYLWRVRKELPRPGYLGVFDRSHYEDVLVVRVKNLVPRDVWEKRYDEINRFERQIRANGTVIVKAALLVSKAEQARRLADRLDRPDKYWKYNPGDLTERALWDDYDEAYQAMFDATSTDDAPWYAIPADNKWFARLAISELLLTALRGLDLTWPPATFDVAHEQARLAAMVAEGR